MVSDLGKGLGTKYPFHWLLGGCNMLGKGGLKFSSHSKHIVIYLKAHCDLEALKKCLVVLFVHLVCGIWLLFGKQMLLGMRWESQYGARQTL